MQASMRDRAADHIPSLAGLMRFSIQLLLGKKMYAVLALLVMLLLSGHLSMPRDILAYDDVKQKAAQDIHGISEAFLSAYEVPKGFVTGIQGRDNKQVVNQNTEFWTQIRKQSSALMQDYSVMKRYHRQPPTRLGADWHALYSGVLQGFLQGFIHEDSDILLRIGQVHLLEDNIYNNARKMIGLPPAQLRPNVTQAQFWRNLFSGSHYFSIAPFIALMLLLHNSFSVDHDSGSVKLINSLPVGVARRNAGRLLGQGVLALGMVVLCTVACSLTYPAGGETHYLAGHGKLLSLQSHFVQSETYAAYLLPAGIYFLRAIVLYGILLLFFCLLTVLLSAQTQSSILALLLPLSLLLILYMPNFMQSSLGKNPPVFSALLSPQMVIEHKAAMNGAMLGGVVLISCFLLVLGIISTGRRRRSRYVD